MVIVLSLLGDVAYLAFRPRGSGTTASLALPQSSASASGSATPRPSASPDALSIGGKVNTRGHCYTWHQKVDGAPAFDVSCSSTHLFEAVQSVTLSGYAQATPYPSHAQWCTIIDARCRGLVTDYLDHPIDPAGKLGITAINPTRKGWADVDRALACGLSQQLQSVFDRYSPDYDSVAGGADAQHQGLDSPTGTCRRFTAERYGNVPCAAPHDTEVVGSFTLTGTGSLPNTTGYAAQAEGPCRLAVSAYLDRAFRDTPSVFTGYQMLKAPSWVAGTRTIECYLPGGNNVSGNHPRGRPHGLSTA